MKIGYSRTITLAALVFSCAACTSSPLNTALGTPKNPQSLFANPSKKTFRHDQDLFVAAYYEKLKEAFDISNKGSTLRTPGEKYDMKSYIEAGFTLSDIYCNEYFRRADESGRRRRYGRSLTNDAGSLVAGMLRWAKAG